MIIRMSKVEIAGPKNVLLEVLEFLRGQDTFHPEPEIQGYIPVSDEARIRNLVLDEEAVGEKACFEKLYGRICELIALLPEIDCRAVYLHPLPIIDVLGELVEKHLTTCGEWDQQRQSLQESRAELEQYLTFWTALEHLFDQAGDESGLEFFGVSIRDPANLQQLQDHLARQLGGRVQIFPATTEEGKVVGLIVTDRAMAVPLRQLLSSEQVPELQLPADLADLPFLDKLKGLKTRLQEISSRQEAIASRFETFSCRWLPIYRQAQEWLAQRLALFKVTASAYETRQCFFIHGWMTTAEVVQVQQALSRRYRGQVVLHELEILERDLDRVPVVLENPAYFQPFEIFSRLLPLPKYSSYDPTPFIGLFFPLLFGMTLGDIGYGLLLLLLASLLVWRFRDRELIQSGSKVLFVCGIYTILFGILYGELFGNLGATWLGLHPVWFDRSQAIVPMIGFAISVGFAHVLIGLGLGVWSDFRKKAGRESLYKLCSMVVIILVGLLLVDYFVPQPWILTAPLLFSLGLLLPLLVIAGGLLAPLELLKSIGNIVSYVRIMAIGFCSVLLAQVANELGGMTGNIVLGILVAGVLHAFNLLLGVFAPTVHTLRLHYVEFFSKFLELGGRKFEPLGRKPK